MANARLIVQSADKSEAEREITNTVSIGSAIDNEIYLRDRGIDSYHAIIVRVKDSYLISSIGNAGAFVNGAQIQTNHPLRDGDIISIGEATRIRFQAPAAQLQSADAASSTYNPNSGNPNSGPKSRESATAPGVAAGGKSSEAFSWLHVALAFTVGLSIVGVVALGYFWYQPDGPESIVAEGAGTRQESEAVEISLDTSSGGITLAFIRDKAEALAGLLSGANGGDFVFENEFIERIRNQTGEFRRDFYSAAEKHKFEINPTFRNDAGLSELFGYLLALSRSRFVAGTSVNGCGVDSDGAGLWRLPQRIVRQYPNKCVDSNQEVCIAANHFSELLSIFEGPEGFMYAVACFGESGERAGRIIERLPDANQRRNFWASARASSMTQDEISRVVCFMAAGVVAQNPKSFGIDSQSLSSRVK